MSKKKLIYNLLFVCTTELLICLMCLKGIGYIFSTVIYPLLDGIRDPKLYEFWYWGGIMSLYLLPTVVLLIYMRVTDRTVLSTLAPKKGSGRALLIGSLLGAAFNALCVLLAAASSCITLTFSEFTPLVIPQLIFSLFPCALEELLCRGYVLEYLKKSYPIEVAAAAGGVLFIFHHINNMMFFGFNPYFALNVFLIGLIFTLAIQLTGSIWVAIGMHTLWNFTQQFIMGLPNSGVSSSLSIFKLEDTVDGFFFNTTYGLEGAPGTTIVLLAILAIFYFVYRRQQRCRISLSQQSTQQS